MDTNYNGSTMGDPLRDWLGRLLVSGALVSGTAGPVFAACVDPEPQDYRITDFRSATPCTLYGGVVVTAEAVQRLQSQDGALLIDVLPAPRRPKNLPADSIWLPKSRWNIPGSVWLANAGLGVLPVEEEAHFRQHLERLTDGDKHRKLVIYCLANCWMSWNAAKRAIEWGYTAVYWFPQGTNGWTGQGHALEEIKRLPLEVMENVRLRAARRRLSASLRGAPATY
jgi:PQQ-dependent catabolism-associated CXXCW motif protein